MLAFSCINKIVEKWLKKLVYLYNNFINISSWKKKIIYFKLNENILRIRICIYIYNVENKK